MLKRTWVLLIIGLFISSSLVLAQGESDSGNGLVYRGSLFKIGTDVQIAENERAENIILIDGNVVVMGQVDESIIVLGGSVTVVNEVGADVVAIGGSVVVESTATVGGNVVTSDGEIAISPGANVEGEVSANDLSILFSDWERVGRYGTRYIGVSSTAGFFIGLIATLLLGLLLTYLMPNLISTQAEALEKAPMKVLGWGVLGVLIFVPLIVLLVLTIMGIALIPLLILAYALAAFLGIITAALVLGHYLSSQVKLDKPTMLLSVALGIITLAILRLIPVFGDLLTLALWIGGLGVVILTRFGTHPVEEKVA